MRSTFYGLEAARSGLYTSQNQLNLTGHNIANVDTLGYTRQRLNTAALAPATMNGQFALDTRTLAGRGVEALNIDQIRDHFTDAKYREEASNTGYWNTKMNEFYMVEQLYNAALETGSTSASINNALEAFQNALLDLESSPSSVELRTNLMTKAMHLTETFNYTYGKLQEQHENLNSAIEVTVGQINDIAESIANYNRQIFGYELTGAKANDLRDSRNLLLDELSGLVDIQYYENSKGYLTVTIGGSALVDGVSVNRLAVNPQGVDNQMDVLGNAEIIGKQHSVVWADNMGKPSLNPDDVVSIQSGVLKAYLELRDGSTSTQVGIPYAAKQLNELARKIAQEINEVHRKGYTLPYVKLDGSVQESGSGVDFFTPGRNGDHNTIHAGNFSVSQLIQENVYLIAASDVKLPLEGDPDSDNMQRGNANNLKEIIKLYDHKDEQTGNLDNYASRLKLLAADIGTQQAKLKTMESAQQVRISAIVQQRASVSGVSLDEEMTNVVRFTHAYNANARIITAIDEELDTLINRMGTVGR